ncbi:hypothetical protein [Bacteroides gallinaceum]|uniref:hypothetical protein n=1 Tax=Bacteroides gallinaceum TaxID=1462571 RepID=UPI00195A31F9|nr:hypothetical protein [Bacteroides gallinaceum]MBM6658482.1 hypothetical protein [Bacteroides gallinaceum]
MDYSARRSSSDGGNELPRHNERGNDGNNRPYRAFEVLVEPKGEGATARRWEYSESEGDNMPTGFKDMVYFSGRSKLCPSGYRVPNQRELMLMYTSLNSGQTTANGETINVQWTGSYWSATCFSFNGYGLYNNSERPGFATDGANMVLTSTEWVWNTDENRYVPKADNVSGRVRCVRDVVE